MYPSVLVLFTGIDVFGDEGSPSGTSVSVGTRGNISAGASITSGAEWLDSEEAGSAMISEVGSATGASMTGVGVRTRWGKCRARVLLISWTDKCKVSSSTDVS
jgi:hypothetical protein